MFFWPEILVILQGAARFPPRPYANSRQIRLILESASILLVGHGRSKVSWSQRPRWSMDRRVRSTISPNSWLVSKDRISLARASPLYTQ